MEIFYAAEVDGQYLRLDAEESKHCVRVLRHRIGDSIVAVDGLGNRFQCRLTENSANGAVARILETEAGWGACPYFLEMAVCPTKNADRYGWLAEKATEIGVDVVSPVIGERSERKVFRTERIRKIVLSAMKQSLKAKLPQVREPESVRDFILARKEDEGLKLIACCFDGETKRLSIVEALERHFPADGIMGRSPFSLLSSETQSPPLPEVPSCSLPEVLSPSSLSETGGNPSFPIRDQGRSAGMSAKITVLIGPEGDFSPGEVRQAVDCDFIPVHLGTSRLRTETAAVTAAAAVYFHFIKK